MISEIEKELLAMELLEALERLVGVFPYTPAGSEERAALLHAQDTIAKAKGEQTT